MPHDIHQGQLMSGREFSDEDLARAAGREIGWVHERVEAGVLQVDAATGAWRFDGTTLIRARRISRLESTFGADPQLAAMTTDLIEEVQALRRRIRALERRSG